MLKGKNIETLSHGEIKKMSRPSCAERKKMLAQEKSSKKKREIEDKINECADLIDGYREDIEKLQEFD